MAKRSKKLNVKNVIKLITFLIVVGIAVYQYFEEISLNADLAEIDKKYSYHFIDVGQGDCTMIHSEELTIVVDSGPGDHSYTTVEYIKQFTDEIDVMILTHPHEDHIGAAADIINKIGVETVIMPDVSTETVCFDKLLDAIEENNCTVKEGKAGEKFTFGDIDIDVYAPVSPDHNDLNNCSIIAKITTGDISTLVTGDAESSAEKEVLDNFPSYVLDADILKVGHHGSSTSTTTDFFEAVSPQYAMISCGEGNSYGHPHREIIQMFEDYNINYYRTDTMGTIVCYSDGEKIAISESYTSGEDYQQS
ncbi:MAG: MBL fold metallo-hydrolase [Clostridia bacterium]|nr:MBL fold metallo-hydrolase [Clostridia bacterium]